MQQKARTELEDSASARAARFAKNPSDKSREDNATGDLETYSVGKFCLCYLRVILKSLWCEGYDDFFEARVAT